MTTLYLTKSRGEPENGLVRFAILFTDSRLKAVRLAGFINREGFDELYVPEKALLRAPNGATYCVWRLPNRPVLLKLFKKSYKRANMIVAGKLSPYRSKSAQRLELIEKMNAC